MRVSKHKGSIPSGEVSLRLTWIGLYLLLALRITERRRQIAVRLAFGCLVRIAERPDPEQDDERRRYYQLTPLGRAVAKAEARRLERLLADARATGLLPRRT